MNSTGVTRIGRYTLSMGDGRVIMGVDGVLAAAGTQVAYTRTCPTCGAKPAERCHYGNGHARPEPHPARRP